MISELQMTRRLQSIPLTGQPMTPTEISKRTGICRQSLQLIERRALVKVRAALRLRHAHSLFELGLQ